MKHKYPKTFAYLKKFEKQPTSRRDRKYYPEGSPFYTMRNMAAYSLSPWKVLWPEVGHTVRAGVCGPMQVGSKKPVLPDHTIVAVSCETKDEAHFICALLNSSAAQCAASGSSHCTRRLISWSTFSSLHLVRTKQTTAVWPILEACHIATSKQDQRQVTALEAEIDEAAAKLWGITGDELRTIQEALAESGKPNRAGGASTLEAD